ncbi:hypothetical protein A3K93_01385 [Acinetobacter sp. NCu2D-2]|uniref:hypothetical protein n=1 Tax=Acinetobacter sp. NCu2D-2 TaxID=1608473 RepID=UPI0007CDB0D5|nr:hypothetical protein [Acinetobacter sp. NCu2D-2]ANF80969.1 hypothetical protein A3K93_01385 [Acinetobacter sp. NCu2D-2]
MAKYWKPLFALSGVSMLMTACQSIDTLQLKKIKETKETQSNALIYCAGTQDCEFERLDQTIIIDAKSGHLNKEAMKQNLVRLNGQKLSQPNPIYLSIPSGQHELVVRFYPISKDKAEVLHVFHNFHAKRKYTLKMYRERSTKVDSLLNASVPDPLCVDLMRESKTIRRFCKPYNVQTGIAEFVERKI